MFAVRESGVCGLVLCLPALSVFSGVILLERSEGVIYQD